VTKYVLFWAVGLSAVPTIAVLGMSSARARGWALAALLWTPVLGAAASINFASLQGYRGPDRGFEVTLTDLIALGLALALLLGFRERVKLVPYNSTLLVLFFLLSAASAGAAGDGWLASFTVFKLVRVFVVYWVAANILRSGVDLRYVQSGLIAIAGTITLIAIKQKYLDGIFRIPGPFDHSNTIPLYLNLILPALFIWGLSESRRSPYRATAALLGSAGMVFAVLATGSRAGLALAGAALVAMLLVANVRLPSRRVQIYSLAALLVGAAGGIKAADSVLDRFRNAPKSSEEARDEFNVAARMMAADHWLGVGPNNFSLALTTNERYRRNIRVTANEAQAGVAHHIYWLTAAEFGYPSLILYVLFQLRFLGRAVRGAFARSREGLLLGGLAVGLATLHLSGFLEWGLRITPVTYQFSLCAGLVVALAEQVCSRRYRFV
jgi:hypothetical protein